MIKRLVYYFDGPGEGNTQLVIEAVVQQLEAGGIKKVVVASTIRCNNNQYLIIPDIHAHVNQGSDTAKAKGEVVNP
jgi:hypothetical protein